MKNIYREKYGPSNNLELRNNPRIKIMLRMAGTLKLKNTKILDIGCHDGTFLSLIGNGNDLFGIEANEWAAAEAKKMNIDVRKFYIEDGAKMPFPDSMFDLIVAGEIIEHIYDTDFLLEEIKRMLKPGGKLLVSTPNVASLGRRLFLLLGRNPHIELSPNETGSSGHIRYFTFQALKDILKKHRLKTLMTSSDVVNFSSDGRIRSEVLAKVFPTFGASIIIMAEK